jgi:5-methylcytosine-specific restriction endonuclease McrA
VSRWCTRWWSWRGLPHGSPDRVNWQCKAPAQRELPGARPTPFRGVDVGDRTCEWCGSVYTPKRRDQRTCSGECRTRHNRAEQNAKRYVSHSPTSCVICGFVYTPKRSDRLTCSDYCWRRLRHIPEDNWHNKACIGCGESFTSKRSDALYCGHECWVEANYDSAAAVERARRWAAANPAAVSALRRNYKIRRHSQEERGPGVSARDWERLLNRLGRRCAYCNNKPAGLQMDHVFPLSRGGQHSIGNVLPACPRCNLSKGARLLVEWKALTTPPRGQDRGSNHGGW